MSRLYELRLRRIMIALAVASQKEQLVLDVRSRLRVQRIDLLLELLPLRQSRIAVGQCWVRAVYQTEIGRCLFRDQSIASMVRVYTAYVVKGLRVRGRVILEEVSCDSRILDRIRTWFCGADSLRGREEQ